MSALQFPAARQPVITVDAQTGVPTFTRPWFLFFQALFNRAGGSTGPTITQILIEGNSGAGVEELQAVTAQANADLLQQTAPPLDSLQAQLYVTTDSDALRHEIGALREQVAELQKFVDGLSQATSL